MEEVTRISKYAEGGQRPLKVTFKAQITAEELLARSWGLSKKEEYKNIWIKRDMNMEENIKELHN